MTECVREPALQALVDASALGAAGAPMLQVALRLAAGKWPVFPCGLDKAPLVGNGFRARSPGTAQIKQWWTTHPEAMPGICPGDQGFAALDVDSTAAYVAIEEADISVLNGFVVQTGGTSSPFPPEPRPESFAGALLAPRHVYVRASAQPKIPGVICRYLSGYVIAPGARRGDGRYRVIQDGEPALWTGRTEGEAPAPTNAPADAPPYERVAEAVARIPNGPDVTRERYVAMAHMVKGSLGDEGLPIFLEWAGRYGDGVNVDEDTRVFETIRAPKSGWLTLAAMASTFGFAAGPELQESAQNDFAEVPLPDPTLPASSGGSSIPMPGLREVFADKGETPRDRLRGMLERVRDAQDDLERALALLALRKSGFGSSEVRLLVGTVTETTVSDEGNTLGELLASPELLQMPEPAMPHLAWPGLKTLLAAREKAGKSTFAFAAAAAASRGDAFLGDAVPPQRILWMTEESLQIAVTRAQQMAGDHNNFIILGMGLNPREQLRKAVVRWAPQVVVIDTLYRFAGVEDENDAVAWMPILLLFDEITRGGAALLILAHATKAGDGGEYRGSSAIGGFVDVILEMKKPKQGERIRRFSGRGRLSYGKPFTVQLGADDISFTLLNDAPNPTAALQARVTEQLTGEPGGFSTRDLYRVLGATPADMADALGVMEAAGQIENTNKEAMEKAKHAGKKVPSPQWVLTTAQTDFKEEKKP